MEVINAKIDEQDLNAPDFSEKIAKETKELNDQKKTLADKVFAFPVTDKSLAYLRDFVEHKAEWSFTESLGVVELHEALTKVKIKGGQIFLKNLEVEALYYFLKKHTAKGYAEAADFKSLLKPLNDAFTAVRNDSKAIILKEQRVASLEHGMDPDVEGSELKQVENEG